MQYQKKLTPEQEQRNRQHAELTAIEVLRNLIARKIGEGKLKWDEGKIHMRRLAEIKILIEEG